MYELFYFLGSLIIPTIISGLISLAFPKGKKLIAFLAGTVAIWLIMHFLASMA